MIEEKNIARNLIKKMNINFDSRNFDFENYNLQRFSATIQGISLGEKYIEDLINPDEEGLRILMIWMFCSKKLMNFGYQ